MYPVLVCSKSKEGNKSLSDNFKVREFACQDGSDRILISLLLVDKLQMIRNHFQAPVIITSAYRTESHNKMVRGASKSTHMDGIAADIVVQGVTPAKVAAYANTLMQESGGIGEYRGFVHIDMRLEKARWQG